MISEIIIPELGATGGDVTIEEWLVEPGEVVKVGQPLYVVSTDKATVEVESFRDGILHTILIPQGKTVEIGTIVALVADSIDEPIELKEVEPEGRIEPAIKRNSKKRSPGRKLASPLARRMAAEHNINFEQLTGSGAQGQILKRDVEAAILALQRPTSPAGIQQMPLSAMRRRIAERTALSKSRIPHFYTTTTIDMQAVIELRRELLELAKNSGQPNPSITDICIQATAQTLREFPTLNARFEGETMYIYPDVNIGLVVGLAEGILVPVILRADQLDLFSLAAATVKKRQRAEAGQLSNEDIGEATFTISNLGMYEIDSFTAVINPPEVGVLALGKIREKPVVIAGEIIARPMMTATLSVDHRVIDGVLAARFLTAIKNRLENPSQPTLINPRDADQ
jgi:pyruvate dehydrogenase E2 component (dihydrolipoamide acetyltransferase)